MGSIVASNVTESNRLPDVLANTALGSELQAEFEVWAKGDLPALIQDLKLRVRNSDHTAQHMLGCLHLGGLGDAYDPDAAIPLLGASAKGHYSPAQLLVGLLYLEGIFTTPNPEQAFWWVRASAEQMNVRALHRLHGFFERGIGVEPHPLLAFVCSLLLSRHGQDVEVELQQERAKLDLPSLTLANHIIALRPYCLDPSALRTDELLSSMMQPVTPVAIAVPPLRQAAESATSDAMKFVAGVVLGAAAAHLHKTGPREYALACAKCGVEPGHRIGYNNWAVCDTCQIAFCDRCGPSSTTCDRHTPWGHFILGDGQIDGIHLANGELVGVKLS